MNAAGRFILVLPNIEKAKTAINKAREEIEVFCRDRYLGQLTINISQGFAASGRFLRQETALESFFPRVANDIEKAKQTRFQSILRSNNSFFIQNNYDDFKNSQDLCPVCGKRPSIITANEEEDENVCKICKQLIITGKSLTKAKYVTDIQKEDKACLRLFGETNISLSEGKTDDYKWTSTLNEYHPGFSLLFGGVHVPTIEESISADGKEFSRKRILSFEELAEQAQGDNRIAMLKADVDDLGSIFSVGLSKKVSLSRFASLSRMINYFFTRYVFNLIESDIRFRNSIYTVFSGGDDLCMVGPWDKIIVFSKELNRHFCDYVGGGENITISAGISVSKSNLPSHFMFSEADALLRLSKSDDGVKNRITLFGTTVPWKKFGVLLQVAYKLEEYLKASSEEEKHSQVGKGLFHRLLEYGEKAKRLEKKENLIRPRDALWISHFYYDVMRNVRSKTDEFKILCLEHIKEIRLPVSYVLYKNRKGGNSDE